MKGIIYATIATLALSSSSLMAFCTKGLPADAAAELAAGKKDGKVAEFKRCYNIAVAEKAAGKNPSDPNFVNAAVSVMKTTANGKKLAQEVGYH